MKSCAEVNKQVVTALVVSLIASEHIPSHLPISFPHVRKIRIVLVGRAPCATPEPDIHRPITQLRKIAHRVANGLLAAEDLEVVAPRVRLVPKEMDFLGTKECHGERSGRGSNSHGACKRAAHSTPPRFPTGTGTSLARSPCVAAVLLRACALNWAHLELFLHIPQAECLVPALREHLCAAGRALTGQQAPRSHRPQPAQPRPRPKRMHQTGPVRTAQKRIVK